MNELTRYLAEEIALDQTDGLIARREALRRLLLLGLSATAAETLLSSCTPTSPASPAGAAPQSSAVSSAAASAGSVAAPAGSTGKPASGALEPVEITFAGRLRGSWAAPEQPRGGVLILHENRGLTAHFQALPGRFAAAGYGALAVDLLSAEGGTASLGESANATAALSKAPPERLVTDMKASLDELARRVPGRKLGAVGFCFGGAMTWRLLGARDPRLSAAAPFYGPLPEGADFTGSRAAVLAVYAGRDARVNATRDAARAALEKSGAPHEIITFEEADHAFFNDTGPRYSAPAATRAWDQLLGWFGRHLG
jgi:carboxymethylenebutenolidase